MSATSGRARLADEPERPDTLFERHVAPEIPVLLRVATTLTGQPADAEDLVQDTLVRAYRAVDRFDGAHPRAWLLTILRNTRHNSTRRGRPELAGRPETPLETFGTAGTAASAEQVALRGQFDADVERALARLSEPQRTVVLLVDVDGLGYADAAAALGLAHGTVTSRLHRARSQLRRDLAASATAQPRSRSASPSHGPAGNSRPRD